MNENQSYEKSILIFAVGLAKEAGERIAARMGESYRIGDKVNRSDLVTEVDLYSERLIRERIGRDYPEHWILSEETDGVRDVFAMMRAPAPGYGWIVDPIDGTINFVHGIPHFAVSIGIIKDGEPLHGVVYNPTTRELYHATRGEGAYRNGERIRASEEARIEGAVLAMGFRASDWRQDSVAAAQIGRLTGVSRSVRILGAASLDLCMVASGRLTGFWHDGLYPWDVAAGLLIVREAGGVVTNAAGEPYAFDDTTLLAANPRLLGDFRSVLYGDG